MAEKPYLAAAFLCERVLQEKDDVLSVVRIVDTLYVSVPENLPPNENAAIQITLLLSFKKASPGIEVEKHQAVLRIHPPSGEPKDPIGTTDFFFKQDELAGSNLIINMGLGIKEFGLFSLDVFVDGELMTRIPFRLLEKQEEPPKTIH